ncbi:hypothetical protein E1263_05755 [Kribbella antibiotica]|uniref:DUF8094 domain-containing protein n=1 Tax=Kribbella antibiotica TaxID=190195 RepID=A0A4R4ZXK7_9ACTN|nr:hypothetical protein [Kribbella antibiotica]TDD61892.1 hypothetical protein E1263_05755 [Kribbella antibiotica]
MRVLRGVLGGLLAVLGLLVTIVGAGAAFWLIGPDDTVYSGEQHLAVQGRALVTSPTLIDQHGPTLHVRARSLDGKPVFLGVGRNFDVASYIGTYAHTSVVQVKYPVAFSTEAHTGPTTPLPVPVGLDWWLAQTAGPGKQSLAWPIQDGPYQAVVMPADGGSPVDVQLEFGIEIPHAFLAALTVLLIGLALLALSWRTLRRRPRAAPEEEAAPKQHVKAGAALPMVAVLTLATGCSGLPEQNTVSALSRPAVTADTAKQILTRYDEVAAKAARTRDLKSISTVEGDTRLDQTRGAYQAATAQNGPAAPPDVFAQAVVAAPTYGSYPMLFAAAGKSLGLWNRRSAGEPWLLALAAPVGAGAKVPSIAGAREANSDATAATAARFAEYVNEGLKSPKAKTFTISPEVASLLANRAGRKASAARQPMIVSLGDQFSVTARPSTLQTTSGEALAFFNLTESQVTATDCSAPIHWREGAETLFSPASRGYRCGLTASTLHSVVLAIPAKGKGNPRVVAFTSQVLKAGGY